MTYEEYVIQNGEEKNVSFVVKSDELGFANATLWLNKTPYNITLKVVQPTLLINATTYQISQGLRVDYVFTNFGPDVRLNIATNPIVEGPATLDLPANTQAFASFKLNATNATTHLVLTASTPRGTYVHLQQLYQPKLSPQTGLVTYAIPVLAFAVAVLLALITIYVLHRFTKQSKTKKASNAYTLKQTRNNNK